MFHNTEDFVAFLDVMEEAGQRLPMRLLAWCLLSNHFHLVLWPHNDGDLIRFMQWLMTSHVRRHHRHYHSSGHVWQGRFKAFPIEEDEHLRTVLRYVERNALRANLVSRAEDWPWSSAAAFGGGKRAAMLHPGPVPRGKTWLNSVNQPQTEAELAALRNCSHRGTPYGAESWQHATAERLGLTINPESTRPPEENRRTIADIRIPYRYKVECPFCCPNVPFCCPQGLEAARQARGQ